MKQITKFLTRIAIVSAMFLCNSHLMAQVIWLNDGITTKFAITGSYANNFGSNTADNNATPIIQIGDESPVDITLTGDFSAYYGNFTFTDGSTLYFAPSNSNMPAKMVIGGTGFTVATTFVKQTGGLLIAGYNGSNNTFEIQPYGVLDLTDAANTADLELFQSLYISSYNDANAGLIKFKPGATTYKLICVNGTIKTDDPTNGQIDVSKHFQFDMSAATGTDGDYSDFIVATTLEQPYITNASSPNVINQGLWQNISVEVTGLGPYDIILHAQYNPPPSVHVAATSGTVSGDYTTLKDAFDKINDGTHQGAITITLLDNTTETATAALSASGSGSADYTSVLIYPTITGLTISGNLAAPLIDLNGADNVTINGSLNGLNAGKDLIITNTSISADPGTSTIRFINGASTNTIKYCTIKGSSTDVYAGIMFFSTTTETGNNSNTIDNNNITNSAVANRPYFAIYSEGTSDYENSGNTINNNNIYDIFNVNGNSYGINIFDYSTAWSITGNTIYETTEFVPEGDFLYAGICLIGNSNPGVNFTISDNYIGGSASDHSGLFTIVAETSNNFAGIYINVGTSIASSVQNNTIQNFAHTSTSDQQWVGIGIIGGNVNVGTTTGNTIGDGTGTGSVTITYTAFDVTSYGVYNESPGTVNIQNNTIGSITTVGSETNSHSFWAVYSTAGTTTISNNTIGSKTTENSINASSAPTGSAQNVYGIYSDGTDAVTILGNTIANMSNSTNETSGQIVGITTTSGSNTTSNNIIYNLSTSSPNIESGSSSSVIGISQGSTASDQTVSGNTIYNLSNTYESFGGYVIGLYYYGGTDGTNSVSRNFIHSLSVTGSGSTSAALYGIQIDAGTTTFSNNIISLGGNTTTDLYGIYEYGDVGNNNSIFFNTVYIDGSLASGSNPSYSLYSAYNSNIRDFRNNIFYNARSTTDGLSLHYAAYFNYSDDLNLTLDYNDYYVTGTGGILGYYNALDVTSLPLITGKDDNSKAIDPVFASAGGTSAANYLPSASTLVAVTGTGITTDYSSTTRSLTYPAMGAYEYTVSPLSTWTGVTNTDWNTTTNWSPNIVPTSSYDAIIPNVTNNPIVNQASGTPAVCNNLTIESGAVLIIAAGKALTVSGTLTNNSTDGIVIQSDETNTGSLIATTATGTGTATVQRYMAAASWRIVTSPLAGQTIGVFLTDNPTIATNTVTSYLRGMTDYNIATNAWNPYLTNSEAASISVGKGYMLRAKSDGAGVVSFNGTLNAAATTVTLDNASGTKWNCVGNPFTSAITNSAIFTANSGVFESSYVALYVYNGVSYDIVNLASDATTITQAGQGFFVKAATTSLSFPIEAKVHDNAAVLRSSSTKPEIKLIAGNGGKIASTRIKFIAGTSTGLDEGYDAGVFKGDLGLNLYTRLVEDNGIDFGLQCLPDNDFSNTVIPLGIESKVGGEVVFSVEQIDLPAECMVILEDKTGNTFTDLSKNAYTTTVAANSSISDRFRVHTSYLSTGLNSEDFAGKLSAYAVRNTEIRLNGEVSKQAIATLYDVQGKVVLIKNLEEGSLNIIGTPNIRTGIYILSVKDNERVQVFKIPVRE